MGSTNRGKDLRNPDMRAAFAQCDVVGDIPPPLVDHPPLAANDLSGKTRERNSRLRGLARFPLRAKRAIKLAH